MINIIDEKLSDDRDILTAKPVGFFKAGGMGFMKGAADIAGAAAITMGGVQGFFGNKEGQEKTYKFYDELIKPSKEYWTPDPASTSMAGKIFGGIAGLGPSLLLGPAAIPTLIGTSALGTGSELIEQGVDAKTATIAGIGSGLVSAAQIKLPASGKTVLRSFGLAVANPVMGAAQAGGIKALLESEGYKEQAKQYDPLDPAARSIDLVLGLFFGGMAHYQSARGKLPAEVEDAIDTIATYQKAIKDTPFEQTPKGNRVNLTAKEKAAQDIAEGKSVDVSEHIEELMPQRKMTETPTLDALTAGLKEHMPNLTDNQLEAAKALLEKRAAREGMDVDEYVSKRFAWIESGDELGKAQFFQKISSESGYRDNLRNFIYEIGRIRDSKENTARDNIFKKYDNAELKAVGEISTAASKLLGVEDNKVYTGTAHFIDHHFNNHPNIEPARYYSIPDVLSDFTDIKPNLKNGKAVGLIFIKKYDKYHTLIANVEVKEGKLFLYKTFFSQSDEPYSKMPSWKDKVMPAGEVGDSSIGRSTEPASRQIEPARTESLPETIAGRPTDIDNSNLPPSDESVNRLEQAHNKEAKGAVQFLEDGRAVIHAFEKADISTVMHELAHVWRRDLRGEDLRIVEKWAGVQDGMWDRTHEETFAKGFERYLAEGKAPSEELKGVFEQFKNWILDIYRRLVYDDVWRTSLNPDVRKVFDRLFVETELPLRKIEHPETIEALKVADEAIKELNDETSRIIKQEIPEEITTVEDWGIGYVAPKKGKGKGKNRQSSKPILNEPVERAVEDIFKERDIKYFKGVDAEGKEVHGSMMEYIDEAKAEYRKAKSLKDVYERIGNCIRMGG